MKSEEKSKKNLGIFPGSFDPFHNGHLDILNLARNSYNKIIVLVANNPSKSHYIEMNRRARVIKKVIDFNKFENVYVSILDKFNTVPEYMKSVNAKYIIRGVKKINDSFDYEKRLEEEYKKLNSNIVVDFFANDSTISSTMIKSYIGKGMEINEFVPKVILKEVLEIWK